MKPSRAFSPAVSDTLETRCVLSGLAGSHVISHTVAALHTVTTHAITTPVTHPTGTFSQGGNPGIITTATGEKISLHSGPSATAAPSATKASVAPTPADVISTPVTHPAGTFSQGNLPSFITVGGGEKIRLSHFHF